MRNYFIVIIISIIITPMLLAGCKGRVEKMPVEGMATEAVEMPFPHQDMQITELAQEVAVETIPPTAASPVEQQPKVMPLSKSEKSVNIQKALKNAGFYTGKIDGKIGPKTRKAIVTFQKSKGLKPDGKVGPITWTELEKYLSQ